MQQEHYAMDKVRSFGENYGWWALSDTYPAIKESWNSRTVSSATTVKPMFDQKDRNVGAVCGTAVGTSIAFSIFRFSIVTIPGITVLGSIGALVGYNYDRIQKACSAVYHFSARFRCHIMQQEMQSWKQQDAVLKEQCISHVQKTIDKSASSRKAAEQVTNFFWSSPYAKQLQDGTSLNDNQSFYGKFKDWSNNIWNNISGTTKKCMYFGMGIAPIVCLSTSSLLPSFPAYVLSITGVVATVAYSIPVGIALSATIPLILKAYHGILLSNEEYRDTHNQYTGMQLNNGFHQHWAAQIETLGAEESVKTES